MSTQVSKTGKGKKNKSKDIVKLSLEEFTNTPAPAGHSVVNVPTHTGLDWAETMRNHEAETKRVFLPTGPRSQRGPTIPREDLPKEPPFKAVVDNLSINCNEEDLRKLFKECKLVAVEIERGTGYLEFETGDDLYEALGLSGQSIKGRSVEVRLSGSYRSGGMGRHGGTYDRSQRGDRDRGGFRSQMSSGAGGSGADEPDNWRQAPRTAPQPPAPYNSNNASRQPYNARHSYDPDRRPQYQRYEGRNSYPEKTNQAGSDRDFANVRKEPRPIVHEREAPFSRGRDTYQPRRPQSPPHLTNVPSQQSSSASSPSGGPRQTDAPAQSSHPQYHRDQQTSSSRPQPPRPRFDPKVILQLVSDAEQPDQKKVAHRNPAIFGEAKPVDTFKKELEIEERRLTQQKEVQSSETRSDTRSETSRSRCVSGTSETGSNHNSSIKEE